MQPEQNILMRGEDDNASDNFEPYEDEDSKSKVQNIEEDHKNLVGKSSDIRRRAREGRTPQDELLGSELSSSLKEVRFSEQEFSADTLVSNINYDYLRSQNNNLFYLFHNQLDYPLAHNFAESDIIKSKVNKSLSNLLIAPFTKKLFYQNADK